MSIKQGNKTIAGDGTVSGVLIDNSIGHIYQSVDLTVHIGTQRCNGTIFIASEKLKEKFTEFKNSGGMSTFNSNPENSKGIPYISFTEYETVLNANVDAKGNKSCGFFGYNEETGEARTPTIAEGTVLAQAVMNGNLMQWLRDALPAIVGTFYQSNPYAGSPFVNESTATGSFKLKVLGSGGKYSVPAGDTTAGLEFNASYSNEAYGRDNEDELRPKSIRYPFLIIVDSYHSTSTSIDKLIKSDSFKPYLFFQSVSNYEIEDISMVNASKFEWIDGKIYTVAYQELLKSYNDLNSVDKTDTIQNISVNYKLTPKKYKIALADQEDRIKDLYDTLHGADYFILDTVGKRFKLPRKNARKLIYSYKEGTEWYNIYSDGWVEQGGITPPGTSSEVTQTLLIKMIDANYYVDATWSGGKSANFYPSDWIMKDFTTISFVCNPQNGLNTKTIRWIVEGYCDTSDLNLPFENEYYYLGNFSKSYEDNNLENTVLYLQEEIEILKNRLGGGIE